MNGTGGQAGGLADCERRAGLCGQPGGLAEWVGKQTSGRGIKRASGKIVQGGQPRFKFAKGLVDRVRITGMCVSLETWTEMDCVICVLYAVNIGVPAPLQCSHPSRASDQPFAQLFAAGLPR